jgi:DNA-binding LacI/PurR family transcriptional regulator
MNLQKRTSLKDIAKKISVSTALISSVINGKRKGISVSAEVAKKITQTAEELNYQPNGIVRSLKKGGQKLSG